jgi:mannose-1-phosphate guanylyltransferase
MIRQAMLMAAGLGTRLQPFTHHEPKALIPLMGVPIAQYAIDSLRAAGVERIVANIHHLAPKARAGLSSLERGSADLIVSDETHQLLGSAGGIRKARPYFRGAPFFLVNADVLSDVDFRALGAAHERLRARWGVTMTLAVHSRSPGVYRELKLDTEAGLVSGFGEKVADKPFFIGAAVMEVESVANVPDGLPSEFLPTILEPAIAAGKAGFHLCDGVWKDIGEPALWLDAHTHLIRALETGRLPRGWRLRIEGCNRRIAQEVWVSNDSPLAIRTVEWAGPAYWDGGRLSSAGFLLPPRRLGPEGVLYGSVPAPLALTRGIGSHGSWVGI